MSETQAFRVGTFGSSPCFIEMYSCVSSAWQWKLTLCFWMTSPRGRIYNPILRCEITISFNNDRNGKVLIPLKLLCQTSPCFVFQVRGRGTDMFSMG
jgi:hypothetical protein